MGSPRDRLTVLVVGSLPPPLGGCSITLQYLVDELRRRADVEVRVVDTSGIRGAGARGVLRLSRAATAVASLARAVDVVSLHVATTALPEWGLAVESAARLAGKPFVLRKFADTDYRRLGRWRGALAHAVVARSDAYLAETRRHLAEARSRGISQARWFPTARPLRTIAPEARERCRRLVYVGHVTRQKGMEQLVAAVRGMSEDVTVDLYGPRLDDLPLDVLTSDRRVAWHGEIPAHAVAETLSRYDAFVMPTTATTEGYPGAIVEALAAGLPVIASRIGGIPELVDDACGLLVSPGDVDELRVAIRQLMTDRERYARARTAAADRARELSTERWCDEFVGWCRELAAARGATRR